MLRIPKGKENPLIYTVILRSVRFRTRREDLGLHTKYLTRLRFSSPRGEEVNICIHLSASVVYLKIWLRSFAPSGAQDDKRRVTCKASAVPLFLPLEESRSIPPRRRLGEDGFWQFRMTRFYQCTLFPGNPLKSRFLARKKRALQKTTLEPQAEGV